MGDSSPASGDVLLRWPSRRSCVVALSAFVIAAVFANAYRLTTISLFETSFMWVIIVTGVIPWALQLLAVLTLIKSSQPRLHRVETPLKFAAIVVAVIGGSWWLGTLLTYHDQTLMQAIMQTAVTSFEQHFTGEENPAFILTHRICGPLIAIGRLHGLYTLAGTDYFHALASICALTGYLTFTARVCEMGTPGPTSVRDVLRFTVMICVIFIPSLIQFGIDVASNTVDSVITNGLHSK